MNVKLIDSLVKVIASLSEAERNLLHQKLNHQQTWQVSQRRLLALHQRIQSSTGGMALDIQTEDLIHQQRQQRDQQLTSLCLPESNA
jgi:hypothetical protein